MTFSDFGFDERIQKGIDEAGFESPMPVQSQTFDLLIKNHRDIYAQSQTGTGKTAAFLLGIFQLKSSQEKYKDEKALVVVPTRELAVQIEREAKLLGKYLDYSIASVFGGVGYSTQERMLKEGVDILIGTPGRLLDFGKQRKINFKEFGFLVIDEADRLFDMGFLPDLRRILKGMRPSNERHTMLFSATLNPRVGNIAWEYMNDPGEVIIEPEKVTVDTVSQELYHVGKDEKMKLLLGIFKRDDPENAVIFTNTRHNAWEVAKRLEVNGYAVESLMGDLPQSKRLKIVDAVKKGEHKFLVATDVAARGLHINELEMVVNYDVPLEAESYVHRIGRTARAGKKGKTITMACEEYVYGLAPVEKLLGRKIPVSWADANLFIEDKSEGMRFPPKDRYRELGAPQRSSESRGDKRRSSSERSGGGEVSPRGKKSLPPRVAKIQSVVSSVAGSELEDNGAKRDGKSRFNNPSDRPQRPRDEGTRGKENRKRSQKPPAKPSVPKNPNREVEMERITSDSSVDERLAYYRKKYGEDFQLPEKASGKSTKGKSHRKPAQPSPQGSRPVKKVSGNKDTQQPPESKTTSSKAGKKGFIGRLFRKK